MELPSNRCSITLSGREKLVRHTHKHTLKNRLSIYLLTLSLPLTLFLLALLFSLSLLMLLLTLSWSTHPSWCLWTDSCCHNSVCLRVKTKVISSTYSWRWPSWCSYTGWPALQKPFLVPSCTTSSPPWWPPLSPLSSRDRCTAVISLSRPSMMLTAV